MTWADPLFEEEEDDGCMLLGEETSADGKQWFLCSEPSSDPNVECTKDMLSVDAMSRTYEATYLCKAPKARAADPVEGGPWWPEHGL